MTPDPSGIPYYDVALFTEVLRTGRVKARTINQIMPWHAFGGMTDDDIAAIFAHLTTPSRDVIKSKGCLALARRAGQSLAYLGFHLSSARQIGYTRSVMDARCPSCPLT